MDASGCGVVVAVEDVELVTVSVVVDLVVVVLVDMDVSVEVVLGVDVLVDVLGIILAITFPPGASSTFAQYNVGANVKRKYRGE